MCVCTYVWGRSEWIFLFFSKNSFYICTISILMIRENYMYDDHCMLLFTLFFCTCQCLKLKFVGVTDTEMASKHGYEPFPDFFSSKRLCGKWHNFTIYCNLHFFLTAEFKVYVFIALPSEKPEEWKTWIPTTPARSIRHLFFYQYFIESYDILLNKQANKQMK